VLVKKGWLLKGPLFFLDTANPNKSGLSCKKDARAIEKQMHNSK
jgi:hypothetical protein